MSIAQKLAKTLKTPKQVQLYLRKQRYNRELRGVTVSSAEKALRRGSFHCFEACFATAAILEHHGYPPLILSLESKDWLDHVIYIFKKNGRWGAVGMSRDEGLYGRAPIYRSVRDLAWSYYDPYVDEKAMLTGYQIAHLDDCKCDWRTSQRNVKKAENYLINLKHIPMKSSKTRYKKLVKDFKERGNIPRQEHWW